LVGAIEAFDNYWNVVYYNNNKGRERYFEEYLPAEYAEFVKVKEKISRAARAKKVELELELETLRREISTLFESGATLKKIAETMGVSMGKATNLRDKWKSF
jgi:DNA-binding NarL/FixJ family response regulator